MALPECMKGNVSLPLIGSPLFIISHPPLVMAQCLAGVVGSFPTLNARPLSQLDEWFAELTEGINSARAKDPKRKVAPFAANLIVHKTNNRLQEDLELCVKYKVPIVITSLGARPEVNDAIHSYGGIVLHDIINAKFARKALEKGADGLVAVAAGAGGHAGRMSPMALIQEIREFHQGPLFLSGAMGTGDAVLAAQAMGADGGYMGSAFIACDEARAVEGYKDAIVDCSADDIIYSSLFTGVHGNYLAPSIAASGLDPNNLPDGDPSNMSFKSGGDNDAKAWRDIWGSGQGIGAVKARETTAAFVARLIEQYGRARAQLILQSEAYAVQNA